MKYFVFPLLVLVTLTSISFNCSENPVDATDLLPPGRRDYIWTVDTLTIPYSLVRRMWGSSSNDVWAIASAGDLDKTIWHYDGEIWTTDGIYRSIDPASIFGFASNNIWLGGHQGEIWHYDGTKWSPFAQLIAKEGVSITWENIWGETVNDIYAVGAYEDENLLNNNGVIAHYDGFEWKLLDVQINNSLTKIYKNNDGIFFMRGIRFGDIDSSKLFLLSQNNLTEIYTNIDAPSTGVNIAFLYNTVLIGIGKDLLTYSNGKLQTFYSVESPLYGGGISGRNLKDIFLGMEDGLAHFNGTDVQYLFQPNNSNYLGTVNAIFENEVFFPFYDLQNGTTYMYKGILSNNN